MKIAFFANSYFPITYGSTVSVENFRLGLEELGHEVHLFTPRFWGYKYELQNIHLYPSVMVGYKIKYPIAFSRFPKIQKEAEELEFDIIHAQHPFSIGCDAMRIAKKNNIPLIFTHHAKYEEYTHYVPPIIPQKLLKRIVRKKVTDFANKCDICISPSQTIKEYMKEREITTQIEVLPTGVECKRLQGGNREETRKRLGVKKSQKIIMFLGRIENEKNIVFLIQEIFPILKNDKNIKLLFVGEGSLVSGIKSGARELGILEQLIFAGLVKQQVVPDFYAATDVFVHASLTETQGVTITEAMASGLPIVAVEASGVIDQLENQKTGVMTNQEPGNFKKEVEEMLANRKKREFFGKAAQEKAKEFDNQKRVKQLEAIYKKAIDRRDASS